MPGLARDGCCSSCHEDANSFRFDCCEVPARDGSVARVCCYAARKLSLKLYGSEDAYIGMDT